MNIISEICVAAACLVLGMAIGWVSPWEWVPLWGWRDTRDPSRRGGRTEG